MSCPIGASGAPVRVPFICRRLALAVLLVWLSCWPMSAGPAAAQEKGMSIELNKLEEIDGGCRVYLVMRNATGDSFNAFKIDLVLFDGNGVVNKRLAVELAPLRPGKTTVRLFDIQGIPCSEVERILLNDVIECRDGEEERRDCVDFVTPVSRGSAGFFK